MKIPHLRYDKDYYGPLTASVDWVAGGNFDGYVYRERLRFYEHDQRVVCFIEAVDASRYDDTFRPRKIEGQFEATDHGTISFSIGESSHRGVFLGPQKSILACSVYRPGSDRAHTICYALQKTIFGWR